MSTSREKMNKSISPERQPQRENQNQFIYETPSNAYRVIKFIQK